MVIMVCKLDIDDFKPCVNNDNNRSMILILFMVKAVETQREGECREGVGGRRM